MTDVLKNFIVGQPVWAPYLTPVDFDTATPEQRAAMQETPSNRKVGDYILTLAHDPEILAVRSPLFNGIMFSRIGLSRAEREFGAVSASIVNGCIYCAAVHALRFNQLTKRPEVIDAVYAQGENAKLDLRLQAIFDFGVALSKTPSQAGPAHIAALKAQGLADGDIVDLAMAVALFGWANRLMHTLGEPGPPDENATAL